MKKMASYRNKKIKKSSRFPSQYNPYEYNKKNFKKTSNLLKNIKLILT